MKWWPGQTHGATQWHICFCTVMQMGWIRHGDLGRHAYIGELIMCRCYMTVFGGKSGGTHASCDHFW